MNWIHTSGGGHYRRWVNFLVSLFLPGSAQFLSGKVGAGLALFVSYLCLFFGLVAFLIHPKTSHSVVQMGAFDWIPFSYSLLVAVEGLRRPIARRGFWRWICFLSLWFGLPILSGLAIRAFLVQPFKVPSTSMQPTIRGLGKDVDGQPIHGDYIFANKRTYRLSEPQRGDVVVFRTQGLGFIDKDTCMVKRVVGLPGETVRIAPPYVSVNGSRISEPDIFRKIAEGRDGFGGYCLATANVPVCLASLSDSITLGPDEYFVLGDNSRHSLDGRHFGPIKRSCIIGKAFYIYAPAERKRRIE